MIKLICHECDQEEPDRKYKIFLVESDKTYPVNEDGKPLEWLGYPLPEGHVILEAICKGCEEPAEVRTSVFIVLAVRERGLPVRNFGYDIVGVCKDRAKAEDILKQVTDGTHPTADGMWDEVKIVERIVE